MKSLHLLVTTIVLGSTSALAGTSKWLTSPLSPEDCVKVMPMVEKYLSGKDDYNRARESQYLVARAACYGEQDPEVIISGNNRDNYGGSYPNVKSRSFVVDSTDKGFRFMMDDGSYQIPESPWEPLVR